MCFTLAEMFFHAGMRGIIACKKKKNPPLLMYIYDFMSYYAFTFRTQFSIDPYPQNSLANRGGRKNERLQ